MMTFFFPLGSFLLEKVGSYSFFMNLTHEQT